jgi:hypothetical protein
MGHPRFGKVAGKLYGTTAAGTLRGTPVLIMARSYKRDSNGKFAGGGGGKKGGAMSKGKAKAKKPGGKNSGGFSAKAVKA